MIEINKNSRLCQIHYYDIDKFDVGIIIRNTRDEIQFISIDKLGKYDGIFVVDKCEVSHIVKKSKYLDFIKKIIEHVTINEMDFKSKFDIIQYSLLNNRIIEISSSYSYIDQVRYVKVISFDGNSVKYQNYYNMAFLSKSIYKINLYNISAVNFDSIRCRFYEKYRVK